MEHYRDDWNDSLIPEKKLKVIIVGAGIGGLVTGIALKRSGHDVIILEQVKEIAEVGAGIQMAPNNLRILGRLGVLPEILKYATLMESNSLRRWKDNEELASSPFMPTIADKYGAPVGVIHRGDLQRILLEAAKKENCDIRTNHKVTQADPDFEARVQIQSQEWIEGDVLVAADGIKSTLRKQIAAHHNHTDHASPTGDSAYRILIPKENMVHDQEALNLLSQNVGQRWMGPGGHIMAYPVKNNTVYNMVLLHPSRLGKDQHQDPDAAESWNRKGSKAEMMAFYEDWCPQVRNLLSYVPEGEVMEWVLNSHTPLPAWVENKTVLVGDACHPMLPYVAQGAAQAMEDAAVLACTLAKSSNDIPLALQIYEEVRKYRAESVQSSARQTRRTLHLPDGPEQLERDRKMRAASDGKKSANNPDLWADHDFQDYIWGTDIMKDTIIRWPEWKARAQGTHMHHLSVW